MHSKLKISHSVIFLVFFCMTLFGQGSESKVSDAAEQSEPSAIPLNEIAGKREELNIRLQKLTDYLNNIPEIEEIRTNLDGFEEAIDNIIMYRNEQKLMNLSSRDRPH